MKPLSLEVFQTGIETWRAADSWRHSDRWDLHLSAIRNTSQLLPKASLAFYDFTQLFTVTAYRFQQFSTALINFPNSPVLNNFGQFQLSTASNSISELFYAVLGYLIPFYAGLRYPWWIPWKGSFFSVDSCFKRTKRQRNPLSRFCKQGGEIFLIHQIN